MITIIHGPPACGKTRNASKLATQFDCKNVLDLDEFEKMDPARRRRFADGNLLLLTTEDPANLSARFPKAKLVAFDTTAAAINQKAPH
ncbi:MAG: hypothetical protein RL490_120 [Pseudomonadota bacterium]|jgi:hypothetical protein